MADSLHIEKIIQLGSWDKWGDPAFCLRAVQQNRFAFLYVKNQTHEICLAAVKKWAGLLRFVKEQTPEICLAAVQQDGRALKYVKEQTQEICFSSYGIN